MAAFELALNAKADVFEIDVRLSKDGHLIVTHDDTLIRTTNGTGLVADQTLQELKSLDAGYQYLDESKNTPWRGKGLELLDLPELFAAFPNVGMNIDIKDPHEEAAIRVAESLRTLNDGRWINVASFHPKILNAFRENAPEISTAASQWEVAALYFGRLLPEKSRNKPPRPARSQVLQIPKRWLGLPLHTQAFIQHAQAQKQQVMYWTINDVRSMRTLLSRGANGLVSDNVLVAREAIDQFNAENLSK